jgi:hypothetical protein
MIKNVRREQAYTTVGFRTWKNALQSFEKHQRSEYHKIASDQSSVDIGDALSKQHQEEKSLNSKMLLNLLESVRFLGRQGLAFRGDGDDQEGNFVQTLRFLGTADSSILEWLKKKQQKFTSHEIQNEFLYLMSKEVMFNIQSAVQASDYFVIMADECTDVSNKEQFSVTLRYIDEQFEAHEEFVGLYHVQDISAQTLHRALVDVLQRFSLNIKNCRGQCYDGAANMAGARNGVAKMISNEEPRAVYSHCYGHALNLAVSDVFKGIPVLRDMLDTAFEITKLIKLSPKRESAFEMLQVELNHKKSVKISAFSHTRWTVRGQALKNILLNYTVLMQLWEECLEQRLDSDIKARINGVMAQMEKFPFLFAVFLAELVFQHTDNLSTALQAKNVSACEGQELARLVVKTLESLRNEENFNLLWSKCTLFAQENGVEEPSLPRKRRAPKRFQVGSGEPHHHSDPKTYFRVKLLEV